MVYNVGYCSNNVHGYSNTKDKCFLTWRNMLKRCYSNEPKYENYRKQGVTVCDEWLDFSVFQKWYKRNYYEIPGEEMNLDKDIINHGNTVYCPENCIFVPRFINQLFVRHKDMRGDLPIGVSYNRKEKCYMSCCSINGRNEKKNHGDVISAFENYKREKEAYIKSVANSYCVMIPERLYNAMRVCESFSVNKVFEGLL